MKLMKPPVLVVSEAKFNWVVPPLLVTLRVDTPPPTVRMLVVFAAVPSVVPALLPMKFSVAPLRVMGRLPKRVPVLVAVLSSVRIPVFATVTRPSPVVPPNVPAPLRVVVPPLKFAVPVQPLASTLVLTPVMLRVEAELLGE